MAKKKTTQKNDFRSYVKWFWILVVSGTAIIPLMVTLAALGAFGKLPTFEEIENPKSNLASQIFTSDDAILGKFYVDNRTHVDYEDLSSHLVQALIATEDERFHDHTGIDFKALARAITKMGRDGGGSTITQQLAKQLFSKKPRSKIERIIQKFKEWVIAAKLERQYTKEEIITMYFNQFDFLYQSIGIHSAASIYFNTTPDKLNIEQSAILVGMAKNPWHYNPYRTPEKMFKRRNVVYYQMVRNSVMEESQRDTLKTRPIEIDFKRVGLSQGLAPYFREYLRKYMLKWIKDNPKADGSEYNLYTDGLKIYTTLDSRMQRYAEEATEEHMTNLQRVFFKMEEGRKTAPFHNINQREIDAIMKRAMRTSPRYTSLKASGMDSDSIDIIFNTPVKMRIFAWGGDLDTLMSPLDSIRYHKSFYHSGMMSVEPQTGFVKAWVGGIDHSRFKYDHVKQGKRQVGSTFKPFVYATAIKQKHYSPCKEVPNVLTCIERGKFNLLKDWCPKNSNNEYGGTETLKSGLAKSLNTITTYCMKQVGPEPVIRLVREMGVKSEIDVQPSIALGTPDLSVYEMVGSYTTFLNKGVYTEPIMITRIEDKNGVVLAEYLPETNEVMNEEDAYVILNLLKGVTTTPGASGVRLTTSWGNYRHDVVTGHPYAFKNPIAGKTGTTQNNSDGWFMGAVPNLVTGVWGGCEDRAAHFGSIYYGQGATVSLPIWGLYMQKCYADKTLNISKADFEKPEDPISIELNCAIKAQSGDPDFEEEQPPEF